MHLTIVWTYAAVQSACKQCSVRPEFSQHYTRCMHTVPRSTACCAMDACSLLYGSHHTPALPHELLERRTLSKYETACIRGRWKRHDSDLHIATDDHRMLTCSPPHVSHKFSFTLPPSTSMVNSPVALHMVGMGKLVQYFYVHCIKSWRQRVIRSISIYMVTYVVQRVDICFNLSAVNPLFK